LSPGPHAADQFPGHGDADLGHVLPTGAPRAIPRAEPHLGLPAALLDDCGVFVEAQLSMPTDLGRVARGPSALAQRPPGMARAGGGHRPLPPPRPPGGCRGGQASIVHALARVVETCEVPACGHRGDRHRALHAAQGLERCDHRRDTPGGAVCLAVLCAPLQTFRGLVDGADICVAHDVRRWGRTDPCRAPPEVGRVPGSVACRADVVPPHKGLQTPCGRCASTERLCPSPAQRAHGFVFHLGDRDRREVSRAHQAGQVERLTAVRFDPIPGLLREPRRRYAPAVIAFFGQRAREPRATRTRFRDQAAACGLRWPLPHKGIKVTWARADGAERADRGPRVFGGLGNRDGFLLDIHSKIKRARLCQG
jgi:hypothetical protein